MNLKDLANNIGSFLNQGVHQIQQLPQQFQALGQLPAPQVFQNIPRVLYQNPTQVTPQQMPAYRQAIDQIMPRFNINDYLKSPSFVPAPKTGSGVYNALDSLGKIQAPITSAINSQANDLLSSPGAFLKLQATQSSPQQKIADLAQGGSGALSVASLLAGGFPQVIKSTPTGLVSAGLKGGANLAPVLGAYGALHGLKSAENSPTVQGQLGQGLKEGAIGAATGFGIGATLGAGGYALNKYGSPPVGLTVDDKLTQEKIFNSDKVQSALDKFHQDSSPTVSKLFDKKMAEAQANGDYRGLLNTLQAYMDPETKTQVSNYLTQVADVAQPGASGADIAAKAQADLNKKPLSGEVTDLIDSINNQRGGAGDISQASPTDISLAVKNKQISPEEAQLLSGDTRAILNGATVRERGFITSVKESQNTPQGVKELVSGDYVVRSNAQLKADALALIKKDPEAALEVAINPQNDVHVQVGNELINYYGSKGDFVKAQQIAEGMANSGTDFGQAVQAFSQYDKTSPQGAIRYATSKVNAYNKLNPTAKLELDSGDVKDLFNQAHAIQDMPEGRARNIAANELINQVNDLIPSSIEDKAITVWKAGLLTSLRTHERNLLGNSIHGAAETAKDIPASLADQALSLKSGQRTLTFTTKGTAEGAGKGLQAAKDIVQTGYDPEESISKYDVRHITWGDNPVEQGLKRYTETVFRTLGAADKPFYNAAFGRSIYDQAGAAAINAGQEGDTAFIEQLAKDPTPKMLQAATKDAEIATFHNQNTLSSVARAVQGLKMGPIPVGQIAAPFVGVPSSIAGQIAAYSPIGLAKGLVNGAQVSAETVPALQRQAAQEIGRGVIGTGLLGIGAYLASKGLITGQPKDIAEAAQWQLEGKQANSILVGGKWRSIGSIGPENLLALAGAKVQQELAKGQDASLGTFASNIGKDYLGQTFLQGVQQPLNAITDPARYGPSYLGNQAASVIPNLVKDTAKAFDPLVRENNNFGDYLTNSIPGLRNQGISKRDALGNTIPQEPSGANAFLDLFNSKTPISNPVIDELSRLNSTNNNATPGKLGKSQTINGIKQTLTPDQLNVLESQIGPQATQALQQLFNSSAYQSLDDELKAKAVDSVMTSVRKQVKGTVDLNGGTTQTLPTPQFNSTSAGGGGQYTIVNPDTGSVKTIDLSNPLTRPTMTGNVTLDKLATSKYNSSVTARQNDIYALYQGGQITQDQAVQALDSISNARISAPKKAKKVSVKISKPKAVKIKVGKGSKVSTFKLPKTPTIKTIKSSKTPSLKFKAYVAPKFKNTLHA